MNFDKVKDVIVETVMCEPEEVTPTASLTDDLGVDSLGAVELNLALEEAFGIEISDAALAEMATVQDLVDHIQSCTDSE